MVASVLLGVSSVQAQEAASSMQELLNQIEQGTARDSAEARQRMQRFQSARNEQQNLLNQARQERTNQENRSQQLETTFAENQQRIIDARTALDRRLGALKELFGVLQTVAGDAQGRFSNSLTNIQYPEREAFLVDLGAKMASANSLASIEDIEQLRFELQREVTEQGKVARFQHEIATAAGERRMEDVVRVGVFNLAFNDGYLSYDPETGNVSELQRQPEQARFTGSAADIVGATVAPSASDSTSRAAVFSRCWLTRRPSDRPHQSGRHRWLLHHRSRHRWSADRHLALDRACHR